MSKPQLRAALELFDNNYKAFRATIPLKPKSVLVNLIKNAPGEVFIEVLSQLDGFDLMRCQKVCLAIARRRAESNALTSPICDLNTGQPLLSEDYQEINASPVHYCPN